MTTEIEVRASDPEHGLELRKRQAELLKEFITNQGLSKNFGGAKDHIYYEGWAFLGELRGLHTTTKKIEDITENGNWLGVRATVDLLYQDRVEATVTASCQVDEPNWMRKPRFQLESMAQTRAASKAFRMRLAPIVALAGFSPTPAEEMDLTIETSPISAKKEPTSQTGKRQGRPFTWDGLMKKLDITGSRAEMALGYIEEYSGFKGISLDEAKKRAGKDPAAFEAKFSDWVLQKGYTTKDESEVEDVTDVEQGRPEEVSTDEPQGAQENQ